MKKTRTKILAGVVLLAAVLLITGIVWAKATKTSVAGDLTVIVTGTPVRYWVDDEGIEHYRGLPYISILSGDLNGMGNGEININLDPMGNGDEQGKTTWTGMIGDLSGTFRGHISATVINGVAHGTDVLYGTGGDFVGMKMKINFSLPYATMMTKYQGMLLNPHGE